MKAGFGKVDITPRVGVEMCGFGPFLHRYSIGVRDPLSAKAMALEMDGNTVVVVSCDLVGMTLNYTQKVRQRVHEATSVPVENIMVHCTHTHSGPVVRTGNFVGWGEPDLPYLEVLPYKIAQSCITAIENLKDVQAAHAEVPCEGIGLNRVYDKDNPPLEEVLKEDWRPAMPERTDTTCHVVTFADPNGRMTGFFSSFGCHPVTCCAQTRYLHGDFVGVASNMLEREHPGAVGLFLQGAQGDVNSCVVHKPEKEALLALDVIASRYARAVRRGMEEAKPIVVDCVRSALKDTTFTVTPFSREQICEWLGEYEQVFKKPDASDEDRDLRMKTVFVSTLRNLLGKLDNNEPLEPVSQVQGVRFGPISLLAGPFEIFQGIKNDVVANAKAPVPLVMGLTNDTTGYAPDREKTGVGEYADKTVPMIHCRFPYANVHEELMNALLELDEKMNSE